MMTFEWFLHSVTLYVAHFNMYVCLCLYRLRKTCEKLGKAWADASYLFIYSFGATANDNKQTEKKPGIQRNKKKQTIFRLLEVTVLEFCNYESKNNVFCVTDLFTKEKRTCFQQFSIWFAFFFLSLSLAYTLLRIHLPCVCISAFWNLFLV